MSHILVHCPYIWHIHVCEKYGSTGTVVWFNVLRQNAAQRYRTEVKSRCRTNIRIQGGSMIRSFYMQPTSDRHRAALHIWDRTDELMSARWRNKYWPDNGPILNVPVCRVVCLSTVFFFNIYCHVIEHKYFMYCLFRYQCDCILNNNTKTWNCLLLIRTNTHHLWLLLCNMCFNSDATS